MSQVNRERNKIFLPNYDTGSIVNLMSSIAKSFDSKSFDAGLFNSNSQYNPLPKFNYAQFKNSQNVILAVIDGMGFEFLKNKGKDSFLYSGLERTLTSVFPPTTAAAITTFATGLPPQQTAFTGWFTYLKKLDLVSTILPFCERGSFDSLTNQGLQISDILPVKPFSNRFKTDSYILTENFLKDSEFTKFTAGKSKIRSYEDKNLNLMFAQLELIASIPKKKYIYAYWRYFDDFSHKHGINSNVTYNHFLEIDNEFERLTKQLAGSNTTLIVTADHGLIDSPDEKMLKLDDHPQLKDCLSQPLCGEPRTIYCYLKPNRHEDFKKYVQKNLSHACTIYKSKDLVFKNWFGIYTPTPKLLERIGDYTLIMKENFTLKDCVAGETRSAHTGNHGGVSKDESLVPLIIFNL